MADYYHQQQDQQQQLTTTQGRALTHHISGKSMAGASLAGVAIGGPLLAMMGFSFMATATLLLVCSPLLLIFSPLLLGAAFVLVGAVTGFTAAMGMALAGFLSLAWICRQVRVHVGLGSGFRSTQIPQKDQQAGQDLSGDLQQRVHNDEEHSPQETRLIKVE